MEQNETYLTTKEVVALLKISRTTLHHWRKDGKIEPKKVGHTVRYKKSDIEKLMG